MRRRSVHRMRMKRKAQCARLARTAVMTAVITAAFAGVMLAGFLVYNAPGLRIATIYVSGCDAGIAEDVLANAESYRNANIVAANLRELRGRIESNPWIERAVIRRQYPDTVSIAVSVREARAIIALDEPLLVDANGVVFMRAPEDRTDLPFLCGLARDDFEKDPATAERMIMDGLQIIAGLQEFALPVDDHVRITCSRKRGYTLQTDPRGPEIYLGFDHYRHKLSALPRMLDDLRSRGLSARYIHLHSHERAFVKLVEQDSSENRQQPANAQGAALPT